MDTSRVRGGAFVALLLLLTAAVVLAPPLRPYARRIAYAVGLRHPAKPITTGQPLGRINVNDFTGATVALQPQPGRRLLINVFTTWCVPCREETPVLAQAAAQLRAAGVDLVGVDQAESPASVERFVRTYRLHYPTYVDSDSSSTTSLDARVIPTTLLIDESGVVRMIHVGPLDRSDLLAITGTPQ